LHDPHCNTTDLGFAIYQPAGARKEAWSRLGKEAAGTDASFAENIGKKHKGGTKEGT